MSKSKSADSCRKQAEEIAKFHVTFYHLLALRCILRFSGFWISTFFKYGEASNQWSRKVVMGYRESRCITCVAIPHPAHLHPHQPTPITQNLTPYL